MDIALLLDILPETLRNTLSDMDRSDLVEVVMDLGRQPEARFPDGPRILDERPVSAEDLAFVVAQVGEFTEENRAGIERTLHRVSAIRNRRGVIVGLTLRVGRAVFGTIDILSDLVESGENLLLLGPPGVGKTTKLREMARVLADTLKKRVMVIDTSNEIGGDGDVPHPGIGAARRMQVRRPNQQHAVMIEAVENHMPEVIIVDEIGTEAEAAAARTIAERGVQLIGTAHGNSLENLILNPTLSDLVGGVATVTIGDDEARRRGSTKTVSERRAPPTFDIVVEIVDRDEVVVHRNTGEAVDAILAGEDAGGERRRVAEDGQVERLTVERRPEAEGEQTRGPRREKATRIYVHGIKRLPIERALRGFNVRAIVVESPEEADVILTAKRRAFDRRIMEAVDERNVAVHAIRNPTVAEVRRVMRAIFGIEGDADDEHLREAVQEVEHAIQRVLIERVTVALSPRQAAVRRIQHRIAERFHIDSRSSGIEPRRHLVLRPTPAS